VDLPAALLAHLQELAASIGQDDQDLDVTLTALTAALRSTATSYIGFELTVVEDQWPVTLAAFTDGHDVLVVGTSLRLPLALVARAMDPASRVIFYAGTPGAFTDMAADLSHSLGGIPVDQASSAMNGTDHGRTRMDGQRRTIELDGDLPPPSRTSGLTGLAELTALNRAIGILVDQGHDIEQAHQLLRSDAAAAGVETQIYAARIILASPASGNDPR